MSPVGRRTSPIQAEYRYSVPWIGVVVGFNHIVLLVAPHTVLWTKGGRERNIGTRGERVQRVMTSSC